jgi:alpha-tubulin suppressor-like RCC1 family protein
VRRRRLSLERTNDDEISDLMTRAFFLSLSGSGASCLLGLSGEAERDKHRSQPGTGGNSVPAPAPALVETMSFAAGAARNDAGCTAADAENVPTYA